jgi:hypothetical protein
LNLSRLKVGVDLGDKLDEVEEAETAIFCTSSFQNHKGLSDFPVAGRASTSSEPYLSSRLPEEQNFYGRLFGLQGHELSFKTGNSVLLPATVVFLSFNYNADGAE